MLTYLINVVGDLMMAFLTIGVIIACADQILTERGQLITRGGLFAGLIIATIRAYITNTRRLVGGWRVGAIGYAVSLVLLLAAIVLTIVFGSQIKDRNGDEEESTLADYVLSISWALLIASYLYNVLPSVLVYPFKFTTGDNGLLSTEFLMRLGGYCLGWLVCVLGALAAKKILDVVATKGFKKFLAVYFFVINVVLGVFNFAKLMLVLIPRKIVRSVALFSFAAKSNNHAGRYTFVIFALLMVAAINMWYQSFRMQEVYKNNAQHRKQRALWRSGKRYSVLLTTCLVVTILCSTWFVKLNTVVIREAPIEDPVIVKDGSGHDHDLKVTLDMVSDGHLHRFGYTTEDGTVVRFIVILKQENTTNYGVGLDACEICGEAGYFENNEGQVVCKKCNVVMNKTTIGMKGGCNPIIIDYDIDASAITVPVSEMKKNASHFKS